MCAWQMAFLIFIMFIDRDSEELNCFQNSVLYKVFLGVRAFSEMNKKDQSSLNCISKFHVYAEVLFQEIVLKQTTCFKGVENILVLADGKIKSSFKAGISKAD